jgi:hypothetical protein
MSGALPVYFTSLLDDTLGGDTNGDGNTTSPNPGDWGHIAFFDTSVDAQNVLDQALIRYGGHFDSGNRDYYDCFSCDFWGAIRLQAASPTVRNTTIEQNLGYTFSADINSYPTLQNNTLTTNGGNGLEIRGGTFAAGLPAIRHWSTTDTAYALTGHVTVPSGVTLIIDPGVVVKFGDNRLLGVNGVLKIQGTSGNPVTLTSLKDDTLKGDTNGDGNATAPAAGSWGHVAFFDTSVDSENLIEYALIRYGGHFDSGNRDYYDCFSCDFWGAIRLDAASPTVQYSAITSNQTGLRLLTNAQPDVLNNAIYDNQDYGLYNEDTLHPVTATGNWWGHSSGPYHATNASGQGNPVSDYVDFDPWLPSSPISLP